MAAPFAKKLYASKAWKQCAAAYKAYVHGVCERCGAPGVEVHHRQHLTPANISNPDIVFGWDNLELLCRNCHIDVHEKKNNLRRNAEEKDIHVSFDGEGNPIPRGRVVIVHGCPYSGTYEYAERNMKHMDIVINFEKLMKFFTRLDYGVDSDSDIKDYVPFVSEMMELIYRNLMQHRQGVNTIWIVGTFPRRADRIKILDTFPGAEMVHIEKNIVDVIREIETSEIMDKERAEKNVERYFRNYEPDN